MGYGLRNVYIMYRGLRAYPNKWKGEKMVNFETLKSEKKEFGRNNFLAVSRGYFLPDGSERFKKSLTIPDDDDIKEFVAKNIREL
jgi:hypothetical protein